MANFKIGDKVKVVYEGPRCGQIGIIKGFFANIDKGANIEFKTYDSCGSSLDGRCEYGFGSSLYIYKLKLIGPLHFCNPLCEECMKNPREVVEF